MLVAFAASAGRSSGPTAAMNEGFGRLARGRPGPPQTPARPPAGRCAAGWRCPPVTGHTAGTPEGAWVAQGGRELLISVHGRASWVALEDFTHGAPGCPIAGAWVVH
jgi:hypothetical protein